MFWMNGVESAIEENSIRPMITMKKQAIRKLRSRKIAGSSSEKVWLIVASTSAERQAVLDDIAWPTRARPELSQGVAFFNRFRDLTASGFFSSKIGVDDLRYRGNTVVMEWAGCPDEALAKLGVSYGEKPESVNAGNRKG